MTIGTTEEKAMELYSVSVKMNLVLAVPNDCEPTDEDIAKALKQEICTNGLIEGAHEKKAVLLTSEKKIPKGWERSAIPWSIKSKLNPNDYTIEMILRMRNR
jgi:hypothetical protein